MKCLRQRRLYDVYVMIDTPSVSIGQVRWGDERDERRNATTGTPQWARTQPPVELPSDP
jgi:hypothetical protein